MNEEELVSFHESTLFEYEDTSGFRKEARKELMESVREGLMKERKINLQRVDTFLKQLKEALMELQRLMGQDRFRFALPDLPWG